MQRAEPKTGEPKIKGARSSVIINSMRSIKRVEEPQQRRDFSEAATKRDLSILRLGDDPTLLLKATSYKIPKLDFLSLFSKIIQFEIA